MSDSDDTDASILIKLHGSFMVIGWIVAATFGTFIARYYKETWVSKRIWNSTVWFMYHRLLMGCTWILTICSAIMIFIDVDGLASHVHAIVGYITIIICFFQPIFGFCRPQKTSSLYKYFGYGHKAGGMLAYILAVVNMFLAVGLKRSQLSNNTYIPLGVFVFCYAVIQISFNILQWKASQKPISADDTKDAPFSSWRKLIIMVYIMLSLILSCVIIAMIWN